MALLALNVLMPSKEASLQTPAPRKGRTEGLREARTGRSRRRTGRHHGVALLKGSWEWIFPIQVARLAGSLGTNMVAFPVSASITP